MVDVETMSTHNLNALILSVGAVRFALSPGDQGTGPAQSLRYVSSLGVAPHVDDVLPTWWDGRLWVLDVGEQLLLGRRVDPDTQKWWAEQSDEARRHWRYPEDAPVSVAQFCTEFYAYVQGCEELWANGVVFDVGNLASLWPGGPPWKYNCVRDARTVYRCPAANQRTELPRPEGEVRHDPVADCVEQVRRLWERGLT